MDEEEGVVGDRGATHVCGDLNEFERHEYIHNLGMLVDGMCPVVDSEPHWPQNPIVGSGPFVGSGSSSGRTGR